MDEINIDERFWAAGILSEWEDACKKQDQAAMILLLGRVDLAATAESISDTLLGKSSTVHKNLLG
jgi:hypothetical protein